MEEQDEFTPRDRGLLMGNGWMRDSDGIPEMLHVREHVLAGEVPKSLGEHILIECGMQERLDASVEDDAATSFWNGFIDGARAFEVEQRVGMGRN